jgi:hypothetical protein
MKAFRVTVRGKKRVIAIPGPGVLSVIVSCNEQADQRSGSKQDVEVSLCGLDAALNQHIKWGNHDLGEGDVVQIEVLPNQKASRPLKRYPVKTREDAKRFKDYILWGARKLGWKVVKKR